MINPIAMFKNPVVSGGGGGCSGGNYDSLTYASTIDMTVNQGGGNVFRKYVFIIPTSDFASAFGDRRNVTAVSLYLGFNNKPGTFEIWFSNSPVSTVNDGYNGIVSGSEEADLAKYYNTSSPTVGSEVKFTLTTPFVWDGSSPIKIIVFTYGHTTTIGSTNGFGGSSGSSGSWGMCNTGGEASARGANSWNLQGTGRVFVKFDTA